MYRKGSIWYIWFIRYEAWKFIPLILDVGYKRCTFNIFREASLKYWIERCRRKLEKKGDNGSAAPSNSLLVLYTWPQQMICILLVKPFFMKLSIKWFVGWNMFPSGREFPHLSHLSSCLDPLRLLKHCALFLLFINNVLKLAYLLWISHEESLNINHVFASRCGISSSWLWSKPVASFQPRSVSLPHTQSVQNCSQFIVSSWIWGS